MKSNQVDTTLKDGVLLLELNRPQKKNAITQEMYSNLRGALQCATHNDDINVVLLRGKEGIFTAGNDLQDFDERESNIPSEGVRFLAILASFQKPIIAEVSGIAIGVGVTMLLHCDLVYAAENTKFRLPFINLGICPEAGSTLTLPMTCGYQKAAELFLLGDFFSAQEAADAHFVNRVIANDELADFTYGQAIKLSKQNQRAVTETKHLIKDAYRHRVLDRIQEEALIFNRLLKSDQSKAARSDVQQALSNS